MEWTTLWFSVTYLPCGVLIMEHWSQGFSYLGTSDDPSWMCEMKNITPRA